MCVGLQVKYRLFLSDFNKTCVFLERCPKNNQILNFIKIRKVGAELFYADGQTDGLTDRHGEAN